MITCKELDAFIVEYLDRDLKGRQRAQFELHISECQACREYLVSYQSAIAAGRSAAFSFDSTRKEAVPTDLVNTILAARRADRVRTA